MPPTSSTFLSRSLLAVVVGWINYGYAASMNDVFRRAGSPLRRTVAFPPRFPVDRHTTSALRGTVLPQMVKMQN